MFPTLTEAERQKAIECLSAIPVADLKKAISPRKRSRKKNAEWIVAETENQGRRLESRIRDDRYHEFVVDLLGLDVLAQREIRLRLARRASPDQLSELNEYPSAQRSFGGPEAQARAIADRNWHPGKAWARYFTRVLGFPAVFAGLPGEGTEPQHELVDPFRPLPGLEDFQEELKTKMLDVVASAAGRNRGILTLPTGAGKTRTAVEALVQRIAESDGKMTVLWIAQSEELCEQAVVAFREVWIDLGHRACVRSPLQLQRVWGSRRVEEFGTGVIVASIQKLERMSSSPSGEADLKTLGATLGTIIVDEAHRITAKSYGQVLRALGQDPSTPGTIPLIGLTATPFRSQPEETRRLVGRFGGRLLEAECLGDPPEPTLQARGVLAKAAHEVIRHDGRLHKVAQDPEYQAFGEISHRVLRDIGEDRDRNRAILRRLLELPPDWPVLFFGCTVEHATAMSVLLRRNGRRSATVVSDTSAGTRRFLVEQFRSGALNVLCNYGVLTTGFDAPRIRALVVARPTASMVLYQQMIGRGLRGPRFGGTDECLVIDVADNLDIADELAFRRFRGYWNQASESLAVPA